MSTVTCVPCKTEQLPKAFVVSLAGSCCCCCTSEKDGCGDCKSEGSEAGNCNCGMFNGYFTLTERSSCHYIHYFETPNKCGAQALELILTKAEYPEGMRFNVCVKITFFDDGDKKVRPVAWGKTGLKNCCNIGVLRRRATNRKCCWPKTVTVSPKPVPDFVAPQPHWHPGNPEDLNDAPFWPTLDVDLKEDSDLAPIRYANGELQLRTRDIEADGFGVPWGHTRIYSNRLSNSYDFGQGTNWLILQNPYLVEQKNDPAKLKEWGVENATGCTIVMVRGTRNTIWFDEVKDSKGKKSWRPRFGAMYDLFVFKENHRIEISAPNGHFWEFHDFCCKRENLKEAPRGAFYRHSGAGDQKIYTAYKNCRLTQVWRQTESAISPKDGTDKSKSIREVFAYRYIKEGENKGRLQYVTHFRKSEGLPAEYTALNNGEEITEDLPDGSIQRCEYLYCEKNSSHGRPGDLKMAAQQILENGSWKNESIHYYRYKTEAESTYCQGLLEYVVGPEAFRRMFLGGNFRSTEPDFSRVDLDLLLISNLSLKVLGSLADATPADQVTAVADIYIGNFDGDRRVNKINLHGGVFNVEYGYGTNNEPNASDSFNSVKLIATELRPDKTLRVVQSSHLGSMVFSVLLSKDHKKYWYSHRSYDAKNGDLNRDYEPSSIKHTVNPGAALDYVLKGLVRLLLKPDSGLVKKYLYESKGNGGKRYLSYVSVQNGYNLSNVKFLKGYSYVQGGEYVNDIWAIESDVTFDVSSYGHSQIIKYNYSSWIGRAQIGEFEQCQPPVSSEENGLYSKPTIESKNFDLYGNLIQSLDARGATSRFTHDIVVGALKKRNVTADGKSLNYEYASDSFGRSIEVINPSAALITEASSTNLKIVRAAEWTMYKDLAGEIWHAKGYLDGNRKVVINPIMVTKIDRAGREIDNISGQRQANGEGGTSGLLPNDSLPRSLWCRRTSNLYSDSGKLTETRKYTDIAGFSASTTAVTSFGYDLMYRVHRVTSPERTITKSTFDDRGLLLTTAVGMDESELKVIESREYDGGNNIFGGNGNLTSLRYPCNANSKEDRIIRMDYNWRDQNYLLIGADNSETSFTRTGQGQVSETVKMSPPMRSTPLGNRAPPPTPQLLYRKQEFFDTRGRTYKTIVHGVRPGTKTLSGRNLTSSTWYNDANDIVLDVQPGGGGFLRNSYDQLGRLRLSEKVTAALSFSVDPLAASSKGGDVAESVGMEYDDLGNQIKSVVSKKTTIIPNAVTNQKITRISVEYNWHDSLGRLRWTANYGKQSNSGIPRAAEVPLRQASDGAVLLEGWDYNTRGELNKQRDTADRITKSQYDDAGREIVRIDNYVSPISLWMQEFSFLTRPTLSDINLETRFEYTLEGTVKKSTIVDKIAGDRVTTFHFLNTDKTSNTELRNSQLVSRIVLPDQREIKFKYNRQSQVIEKSNAWDVTHTYGYDELGRMNSDIATVSSTKKFLGSIAYRYNYRGLISQILAGDCSETRAYDDLDQLTNVATVCSANGLNFIPPGATYNSRGRYTGGRGVQTFNVSYSYSNNVNRYNQLDEITYPKDVLKKDAVAKSVSIGRDFFNRVNSVTLKKGGGAYYNYVGLTDFSRVVITPVGYGYQLQEDSGANDHLSSTLDRFDRAKRYCWSHSSQRAEIDLNFDYSLSQEILSVRNSQSLSHTETLAHDGLDRLVSYRRGMPVSGPGGIVKIPDDKLTQAQQWNLDTTGNWTEFDEYNGDAWNLRQVRTHTRAGDILTLSPSSEPLALPPLSQLGVGPQSALSAAQLASLSSGQGEAWASPRCGPTGNLDRLPAVDEPGQAQTCTYDAWNRLRTVSQQGKKQVEYQYDGLGRMVLRLIYEADGKTISEWRRYVYDQQGNLLQEAATTNKDTPYSVRREYVWGPHGLILRETDQGQFFTLPNARGSVAALVDEDQEVVERYQYDPYGRVHYQNPDFTPREDTNFSWNLLWQTGYRDPLTGIYLGSDGSAYHERLGRTINPQAVMAQSEAGFAANYQKAVDSADPATFNLLKPPPAASQGAGMWGIVGGIAVSIVVGAIATAFLPVTLAVAGSMFLGGAASGLFEYEANRRARGEDFNFTAALDHTMFGAAMGLAGGYAFKALGWIAWGLGKTVQAAGRAVVRGGRAIGARFRGISTSNSGRRFVDYSPEYVPQLVSNGRFIYESANLPLKASINEILEQGVLPGLTGVTLTDRTIMFRRLWDLTAKHDVEFALTREILDGNMVYRLYSGGRGFVEYAPKELIRRIAHTHPSGNASISIFDITNHDYAWLKYFASRGYDPYTPLFPSRVIHGPGIDDYKLFWPSVYR